MRVGRILVTDDGDGYTCFDISAPLVVQQNLLPVLRESEETALKPHQQICSKLLSPWLAYQIGFCLVVETVSDKNGSPWAGTLFRYQI